MKNVLDWLLARAKERSTWVGITALVSAAGVALHPELVEAIAAAGTAIAGLIAVATADKK